MRNQIGMATVAGLACLALASCGKKEPTGQVVATVAGEEITAIDLRNEMGAFNAPNAQVRKQAEQAALQQIINRKLIAKAADKAGVAKTPEFAQQKERMDEALLAQAWQGQIVKQVPAPSKEEVDRYIGENPDIYAQRKIFDVEQVRMTMPTDRTFIKQLEPLKTLEEIVATLEARGVRYQRGDAVFDSLSMPPQLVGQIVKLPPNEVFIIPSGNLVVINRLKNTRIEPVAGDTATKHATQVMHNTRAQEALRRQFAGVVQAGAKEVVYSKAYEVKPPAKAAAPAPAPKAK